MSIASFMERLLDSLHPSRPVVSSSSPRSYELKLNLMTMTMPSHEQFRNDEAKLCQSYQAKHNILKCNVEVSTKTKTLVQHRDSKAEDYTVKKDEDKIKRFEMKKVQNQDQDCILVR